MRRLLRWLLGTVATLAAIAVKSEASQQAAREAYPQADISGDYHDLLKRDDLDVVDIVVPNVLHYEVAKASLEAGKHLLLEKPMALEADQCDQLVRIAADRQRLIAINHELRHSSLWGGVRRLIDEGVIGRPQYAMIELTRFPYRTGSEG